MAHATVADSVNAIEEFVRSLDLDAYLVGGVVRDRLLGLDAKDADFLVLGLDSDQLRAALARHGSVENLVVAGRTIGVRLRPYDSALRALVPAGIEFAPPRRERSTGPGRHDFEIVVDPSATVEDDLARRDFTVNAMAQSLRDGRLIDPFDGQSDVRRRILRTVGPESLAEDPLRLVRGLRFVSELDLDPDERTLSQMRAQASAVAHVSGERIGGGLSADGMGELSKLLLGAKPEKALVLARQSGVLVAIVPDFAPAIGLRVPGHELTLDEHILRVVQCTAEAGLALRVRLAALLHDLGKTASGDARSHAEIGAALAGPTLRRLRYPNRLRRSVVEIVAGHTLHLKRIDAPSARQFLALHGEPLAFDLLDHRRADLRGKRAVPDEGSPQMVELEAFAAFVHAERSSPHRLADLAIDGGDLIELGFRPGAKLGAVLRTLLDEVIAQPQRNSREELLRRARELAAQ